MGTDQYGRDVLSRLIYGSRISLAVGLVAVSIYIFIGTRWDPWRVIMAAGWIRF